MILDVRPFLRILSACAALGLAVSGHAERVLVFEDDFEGRSELGSPYKTAMGGSDSWPVVEGVLMGSQAKPDHGAIMRYPIEFKDIDIEVDFRFNGGSRFNFVIDDENEKSVHAGHICRASISPIKLSLQDDKTGNMNLKIREMRKSKTLSEGEKDWLGDHLAKRNTSTKLKLKKGQWYHLRIVLKDTRMEAFIDEELVTELESSGIAHPTKTKFGVTVNGETIDFDNLKVYRSSDN